MARKTARQKLADSKDLPKIEKIEGKLLERWGAGTYVIPAPMEVDAVMRRVPEGKLITINDIRAILAKKHGATMACPICTGIFASIAARAAEEDAAEGETEITPYWRTLKEKGELNPKYPGGLDAIRKRLENEGHTVAVKGKRLFVVDFVTKVWKPPTQVTPRRGS